MNRGEIERSRKKSYYQELGIPVRSTQKEIEIAFWGRQEEYRRRKMTDELFRLAEEAYQVLSDPARRGDYDRQIGLVIHPAWRSDSKGAARRCFRAGLNRMARGRETEALALLERSVRLDPEEPHPRSYLALLIARTGGCRHTAVHHGRRAAEAAPDAVNILWNLSRVYRLVGLKGRAAVSAAGWLRLLLRKIF